MTHKAGAGRTFQQGDFDYNGRVDADDYFLIDSNHGKAQLALTPASENGAEFYVRVQPDESSVRNAARSLGDKMGDASAVRALVASQDTSGWIDEPDDVEGHVVATWAISDSARTAVRLFPSISGEWTDARRALVGVGRCFRAQSIRSCPAVSRGRGDQSVPLSAHASSGLRTETDAPEALTRRGGGRCVRGSRFERPTHTRRAESIACRLRAR